MSKELEALLTIYNECVGHTAFCSDSEIKEYYNIIETALKSYEALVEIHSNTINSMKPIEKKLKAFDIIKEKEVNVGYFIIYINKKENCYEWYKKDYEARFPSTKELLTQEEYDLLKEVLL